MKIYDDPRVIYPTLNQAPKTSNNLHKECSRRRAADDGCVATSRGRFSRTVAALGPTADVGRARTARRHVDPMVWNTQHAENNVRGHFYIMFRRC